MKDEFELRERDSDRVITLHDEEWPDAMRIAAALSGNLCSTYDVFVINEMAWHAGDYSVYVTTYCGGYPYWSPTGGSLCQIAQARFGQLSMCWDCQRDSGKLVHHPDTPEEAMARKGDVDLGPRWQMDDRCEACGGGFTWVYPDGLEYAEHDVTCWTIHAGQPAYSVG